MKKFFVSFLGAMAALWITGIIVTLGLVVLIVALSANKIGSDSKELKSNTYLMLNLADNIVEHQEGRPEISELIMGNFENTLILHDVVNAIEKAADDKKITGLYIEAGDNNMGLAQANALIAAIKKFKASGKPVYAYGDSYSQKAYYVASLADSLIINPYGMIDIHGLTSEVMFYKGLFDKLGVKMQVVRVGSYKSAVEPFIRTDMSEASREQTETFLGALWGEITKGIADNRKVRAENVNAWADSAAIFATADFYKENKMVDGLMYRHEMDSLLRVRTDRKKDEDPRLVSISDYYSAESLMAKAKGGKHIAVLYAEGDIAQSGENGITSDAMLPIIEEITNDEDVAGLILRVNSPGGDAYASELIWDALEQFKKTGRPFYVSMSDVAASGGYYISCGADKIFAEPLTITGSIGIFGMVPDASDLMNNKLGITMSTVSTNPEGQLPTAFQPMTPRQTNLMQAYVNRGYELFTSRCAKGRNMPQDSIKAIGQGRVWDGINALRIGLVDELGGLGIAIAQMAQKLDLDEKKVVNYPQDDDNIWAAIRMIKSNIEMRIVKSRLGSAYPFYQQVEQLRNMNVLQARMEMDMPK